MAERNKDRLDVVVHVVEPEAEVQSEIRAILETVEDWQHVGPRLHPQSLRGTVSETLNIVVLGPTLSRRNIESEAQKDQATVLLNPAGKDERRLEAYRAGVGDVVTWPTDRTELVLRIGAVTQRWHEHRLRLTERRDLDTLLDLSEAISNAVDMEQTLYQISHRMAEVMGSERCSIIILDDSSEFGYVVAASDDQSLRQHRIPVGESYPEILEVVRTAAPVVIDDVNQSDLFDGVREKIRDKPVGNTALFPVLLEGKVQGVVHLRGADVRKLDLSRRQIRFGTIIANVVAVALRNARMYQSIRERAERVLSARFKAEQKIRDLEKYQRFFDLSGDGIVIVDGRGRILFSNREARAILGFGIEDITQLGFKDIASNHGASVVEDLLAGFALGRHKRELDLDVIRSSGETATLSLTTASLDSEADESAAPADVAAIVSFRDVTETRAIERELRKTTDFLENLIESSGDAIIAADTKGRILVFNASAERITGWSSEDVIGRVNVSELYEPSVPQRIMKKLRADPYGKYTSARENLLTKDRSAVPISLRAALLYDQGREIATVGIFTDLRAQLQMEARLADAQKKLAISERQAGALEVAGAAAHELSQPLTAIVGSAELVLRKLPEDSPARKSLDRILEQSERMAAMLQKIGHLTKYRTKPYLGDVHIVDLDASSPSED